MANRFEQGDLLYLALVNDENQHSLWPSTIEVPEGWTVELGPASRDECVRHVEAQWDMRARSPRFASIGEF